MSRVICRPSDCLAVVDLHTKNGLPHFQKLLRCVDEASFSLATSHMIPVSPNTFSTARRRHKQFHFRNAPHYQGSLREGLSHQPVLLLQPCLKQEFYWYQTHFPRQRRLAKSFADVTAAKARAVPAKDTHSWPRNVRSAVGSVKLVDKFGATRGRPTTRTPNRRRDTKTTYDSLSSYDARRNAAVCSAHSTQRCNNANTLSSADNLRSHANTAV